MAEGRDRFWRSPESSDYFSAPDLREHNISAQQTPPLHQQHLSHLEAGLAIHLPDNQAEQQAEMAVRAALLVGPILFTSPPAATFTGLAVEPFLLNQKNVSYSGNQTAPEDLPKTYSLGSESLTGSCVSAINSEFQLKPALPPGCDTADKVPPSRSPLNRRSSVLVPRLLGQDIFTLTLAASLSSTKPKIQVSRHSIVC